MTDNSSPGSSYNPTLTAGGATISFGILDAEAPANFEFIPTNNSKKSHPIQAEGDMPANEHQERTDAVEKHLCWIRSYDGKASNERATWLPTGSESGTKTKDITWGRPSPVPGLLRQEEISQVNAWDKLSAEAFQKALKTQQKFTNVCKQTSKPLSHTELDVQGIDAKGNRLRVQRILEVMLHIHNNQSIEKNIKSTTMQLKRILIIKSPGADFIPPRKPQDREPYQMILEQLAQHEVDQAFDERNYFLREVFAQNVDHARDCRESTIGEHKWSFQRPEISIRGPDGTVINLIEERTDSAGDGEVVLTHMVRLHQEKGDGRCYLFDLLVEGNESERRVRMARWSISSAVDRYLAKGSAERFVLDKWVDGAFLPKKWTPVYYPLP